MIGAHSDSRFHLGMQVRATDYCTLIPTIANNDYYHISFFDSHRNNLLFYDYTYALVASKCLLISYILPF